MSKHALTAIIYDKRGRVLAISNNNYVKTHPLQAHHARKVGLGDKVFLHAETSKGTLNSLHRVRFASVQSKQHQSR